MNKRTETVSHADPDSLRLLGVIEGDVLQSGARTAEGYKILGALGFGAHRKPGGVWVAVKVEF